MLGTKEADALGTKVTRLLRILGCICIGTHSEQASFVYKLHEILVRLVTFQIGIDEGQASFVDSALGPIERDPIALAHRLTALRFERFIIISDFNIGTADDTA